MDPPGLEFPGLEFSTVNLSNLKTGVCRIEHVRGPVFFRNRLGALGFVRGTELLVVRRIPSGMIVRVRGSVVALSPDAAALVDVQEGLRHLPTEDSHMSSSSGEPNSFPDHSRTVRR